MLRLRNTYRKLFCSLITLLNILSINYISKLHYDSSFSQEKS